MACGRINPDGSITITHPDINIYQVLDMIRDVQTYECGEVEPCHEELLATFTGKKVVSDHSILSITPVSDTNYSNII